MNKCFYVGVLMIGSSLLASEQPLSEKAETPEINVLRSSVDLLRKSSDAITIPALKKSQKGHKLTPENVSSGHGSSSNSVGSSGSSPLGAEHLFPGQSGIGYMHYYKPLPHDLTGSDNLFYW